MKDEKPNHVPEGALKSKKHDEAFENSVSPPDHTKDDGKQSSFDSPDHGVAGDVTNLAEPAEEGWVAGFQLVIMLISITLAAFLMMLDTSIVATVSRAPGI